MSADKFKLNDGQKRRLRRFLCSLAAGEKVPLKALPASARRKVRWLIALLLEEKAKFMTISVPDMPMADSVGDQVDHANTIVENGYAAAGQRAKAAKLALIEDAIARLFRNPASAGDCQAKKGLRARECSGHIDLERLACTPWASLCVHCQSKASRLLMAHGRGLTVGQRR